MKKYLLTLFILSFSTVLTAQEKYAGTWEGDLDAGMQQLRLVFTITNKENQGWKLFMQSPQQSAMQMPADTVYTEASGELFMEIKKYSISFKGNLLNDSIISGTFTQGMPFPLQLKKVEKVSLVSKPNRPQTPKPPYTYKSIDVSFSNADQSLKYGATLTLPDTGTTSKFPAVILISGSGAQDRDETIFGHKPFAVIADHLTKNGFAVLRVDDRGVGKSSGNHSTATSKDFADDKEAALNYLQTLKWIDPQRICLIGHSEGGMIAPLLAAKRKDIKAIILLAGPGVQGYDLLAEQNVAIFKANGVQKDMADAYGPMFKDFTRAILHSKDTASAIVNGIGVLNKWNAADSVKEFYKVATAAEKKVFTESMVPQLYNDWFRYFLEYDPAPVLKKLTCNVLALNGTKDLQVLPASNLAGIKAALQKSKVKSKTIREIEGVNHLFQTCKSCSPEEYAKLEESFSPEVLDIMTTWLKKNL